MLTISKDHCLVFCHQLELKIAPINHPQSTYFLLYLKFMNNIVVQTHLILVLKLIVDYDLNTAKIFDFIKCPVSDIRTWLYFCVQDLSI